jgi:hypothetical protein
MSELEQDQEQERGPGRVSIWRTAKGDPRWKVTASVGLDDAELERALAQAVRADRELEREYAGPPKPFRGEEPKAAAAA